MLVSTDYEKLVYTCPQCEATVYSGARFCHHCGQRLFDLGEGDQTNICPKCKVPTRQVAKFCHRCGRRLPDLKKGDQIGNYIIESFLGAGGIGAVYLSHHKLLKYSAALKIHDYFSSEKSISRAFLRSSNYLSQMDHPHIVHLYDYGFQNERAYQAIEYIDGPTLSQLLPRQQTKAWVDLCIKYFVQILSALHYAHTCRYIDIDGVLKRGILHGDIKLDNLFFDWRADAVKLTDFMIPDVQMFFGKKQPNFQELEEDIYLFSTQEYMAPEQKSGHVTAQTDIFNLGVTMYQLLTGWGSRPEDLSLGLRNAIPPIHENPYIPIWLNNVIIKAIERDSSERFQTIAEMIRIFQEHQNQSKTFQKADFSLGNAEASSNDCDEVSTIFTALHTINQKELAEALKRLKETILESSAISSIRQKQNLVHIVQQIENEAVKAEPNIILLRIIINGLLETLQTIPDASLSYLAASVAPLFTKLYYKEQKHMSRTIRILFLAANPKDTQSLRLDEEIRSIDSSLRQAEFRDIFDIKQHWDLRVTDLQGYLLRHQPDIVHFSGHGSPLSEIILEDNNGKSHPISPRALSQVFSVLKDNVRCVVLNACYSDHQAQAIAQYIDCVVGMSKAIGDNAAISFASAFYQALGYGRNIKTAFELGCAQIDLENLNEQDTPKLLALNSNPVDITFVEKSSLSSNRCLNCSERK